MELKHHLAKSLQLQPLPSPWPRMILCSLSVTLPLILGFTRQEFQMASFGAFFGFMLILNDHFGPLAKRLIHLLTAYFFIVTGFFVGILLSDHQWMILITLFIMTFLLGKSKGLGLELERMLLFSTLQLLGSSQTPEIKSIYMQSFFYSLLSLALYIFSLCLVYLVMRHKTNFQKSKRQELKEALTKKETNRYALTMAVTACVGLTIANFFHVERGYWVVGTIIIVMMPDHYQSLYKSFQRGLGTLIGVFGASLLMMLGKDPIVLISFCAVAAFMTPYGQIKNYWLANVFIAGLILFFLEISKAIPSHGNFDLAFIRFVDIGLGCLIGILGTLIAFPQILRDKK